MKATTQKYFLAGVVAVAVQFGIMLAPTGYITPATAQSGGGQPLDIDQYIVRPISISDFIHLTRQELTALAERLEYPDPRYRAAEFYHKESIHLTHFAAVNRVKVRRWFKAMAKIKSRRERVSYLRAQLKKLRANNEENRKNIVFWDSKKQSFARDLALTEARQKYSGYIAGLSFLNMWIDEPMQGPMPK